MHSAANNTTYKLPNEADIKYHTPKKYIPNDMFLAWVAGKFPVDRLSDKLVNDKHNKYSLYHYFGSSGLFQNGLLLKAIRLLFDRNEGVNNVVDPHASFHGI